MRGRMNNVEKAKNFKDSIRKLMTSLKPYLFIIIIAIVLIILSTVCTLIGPNRLSKMTDLIEEGKGGYLTGVNDAGRIARGIRELADNPGKASVMGQFNKKKIENYSIDILKDRLLHMYNSL